MRALDTSNYLYEFVGGELNGKMWHYASLEVRDLISGYNNDLSVARARGRLCQRAELDNQPLVDGYYGPMYGGMRYEIGGELKYDFMCSESEKKAASGVYHVIRYESPEAYDMLSR